MVWSERVPQAFLLVRIVSHVWAAVAGTITQNAWY